MAGIRFGCGEFVPGGEPIIVPPLPVPTPVIIIPDAPKKPPLIPPFIPDRPVRRPPLIPPFPGPGVPTPNRPPPTGGPTTGGPGGPGVGIPSGSQIPGTGGPITGGGSTKWKCQEVRLVCPGDEQLPPADQRVLRIVRDCVTCNPATDPQCIHNSKNECLQAGCADTVYTGVDCNNVNTQIPLGTNTQIGTSTQPNEPTNFGITEINIQQEITNQQPQNPSQTNTSEIYNNSLNFFETNSEPGSPSSEPNNVYPQTFNTTVAHSVGVLLRNEGSVAAWTEPMLFALNTEDIKASLNPSLLNAFNLIHYPGGQVVGEQVFLEVLAKHLLTGTMSEFDAGYYLETASKQLNDRRIKYTGLTNSDLAERAGLGVIAAGAVVADPEAQTQFQKRQIRRQRRLNTDIRANILVDPLSGECMSLFLTDAGICVDTLGGNSISVPTGDGDGYYIQIDVSKGDCDALVTISDFSSTYYVPPDVRFNALTLFRESPNVTLTASSLENSHEFTLGATGPSELKPLYMTLDLESMSYTTSKNPLVAKYGGNYVIEEDQEIIDEHTTNNGFAVTRVNIDYRDPLYQYILESSSVGVEMNDINFKSIKDSKDFKGGIRISRNIPFALIVTPVVGSKYNPFNGFSEIQSVDSRVVRSMSFKPDISLSDTDIPKPQLREVNLYNEASGALKVGLVEPVDSQNIVHRFEASNTLYTNTFYNNGEYTTSNAPVSSHGISYLVKDVVDYLIDTYDPDDMIWFDVLRRMPLNRVGELLYNTNLDLISRLERGYRNDIPIYSVIKSDKVQSTEVLADDEKVVITVNDRNGTDS